MCYLLFCQSSRPGQEMKCARQRGGLNGVYSLFASYKQKAPVDLLFLELHTDNDVGIISSLPRAGGGKRAGMGSEEGGGEGGGGHKLSNLCKWSPGKLSRVHY